MNCSVFGSNRVTLIPAHVGKPDVSIDLIVGDSIDGRVRRGRLVKLYRSSLHIQFAESMAQEITEPKIVLPDQR